jgi:hypothetical protein
MLAGVLLACSIASAQTFYKWTDQQGIVHFSDAPPPDTKGVEERRLPAPLAAEPARPESDAAASAPGAANASAGLTGPARIIIVSQSTPRTGPSAMHISGQVRNVGGADARSVAVTISVTDDTQGNPCLSEEAPVEPPTLHPGETGSFDIDVDNPCLYGQPGLDVAPVWE